MTFNWTGCSWVFFFAFFLDGFKSDFIFNCWEVKQNLWGYLFKWFSCFEDWLKKDCGAFERPQHPPHWRTGLWVFWCQLFYDVFGFILYQVWVSKNQRSLFYSWLQIILSIYFTKRKAVGSAAVHSLFFLFYYIYLFIFHPPHSEGAWEALLHMCCLTRVPERIPDRTSRCLHCVGNMCGCVWEVLSSPQLIRASPPRR